MNTQSDAVNNEISPSEADSSPKQPWQAPSLEELPVEATAAIGGPGDDGVFVGPNVS